VEEEEEEVEVEVEAAVTEVAAARAGPPVESAPRTRHTWI